MHGEDEVNYNRINMGEDNQSGNAGHHKRKRTNQNGNNNGNSGGFKKPYKKKEGSDELAERRNKRILQFFKLVGLNVRLVADANSPAMILDDKSVINAYVHNFELRFTDNPIQGNVVYTVKLTDKPSFDKNKVLACINDYEMRKMSKVVVKGSEPPLYLSGYNFLNKEEKLGRYPVFAAYSPKVYFNKEKADEICAELNADGYSVDVC